MDVRFKKVDHKAISPQKTYGRDFCFDLFVMNGRIGENYIEYNTGIVFEIPYGYVGLVFPDPRLARKPVSMASSAFVIEPDNRMPLRLRLRHFQGEQSRLKHGDKIAKIIIIPTPEITLIEATRLSGTDRSVNDYE